jgi:hypothetical protein
LYNFYASKIMSAIIPGALPRPENDATREKSACNHAEHEASRGCLSEQTLSATMARGDQ